MFERRDDPAAINHLAPFLPSDTTIESLSYLTFLSAYFRERCTRLSSEEEKRVEAYIEEQELLAVQRRDQPWFLDDNYEDKPLLAENKYIQE